MSLLEVCEYCVFLFLSFFWGLIHKQFMTARAFGEHLGGSQLSP